MSGGLEEALRHLARGYATLPIDRNKEPARALIRATRGSARWRSLRSDPAREDEIRAWFELDPSTGIGVITGEPSGGLVVVDVDDPAAAPTLPPTATVTTGRCAGAHHAYYRTDGRVRNHEYAWGEVRAEDLYVVSPLSRHRNGGFYRWQLSPEDVGELTSFSECDLAASTPTYVRTCLSLFHTCHADGFELSNLDRDEACALRLGVALGAPEGVRLGESFPCVLHTDGHPSASLWRAQDSAHVLYHDWHRREQEREWLTLAQVRARLAGRFFPLAVPELVVWKLRLAREAGLLEPPVLRLDADRPPRALAPLYDGFLELLALRWTIEPDLPAPFSVRFAAAWCGLPKRAAHEGIRELQRSGLLRLAGRDARGNRLWLPQGLLATDPTKERKTR
jgi:hypothetical protein